MLLNKLSFLVLILLASGALADFYAQVGAGVSKNSGSVFREEHKFTYKDSTGLSMALGYELPIPLLNPRIEAEYLRVNPKVKGSSVGKLHGAFINGYVQVPILPIVDPYVGAGIGNAKFDHNHSTAVQGMAGLEYTIPVIDTTIGGEYRYLKVNEVGGRMDTNSKYHTNIFMVKARYSF